jgi:hypothetical protein
MEPETKTTNRGAFVKGQKRPGQGRPAGSTNKKAQLIREMVTQALDQAGGVEYLAEVARTNPGPFLGLVGKVLPIQVTGAEGGPVQISWPVAPPRIERA